MVTYAFRLFYYNDAEAVETRFLINLGVLVMELEKKADNGNEIDFDALIENVKKMPEREGQILLWAITFRLEKWYFIARPVSDPGESRPFIGEVDGRGWVFIFTDNAHVRKFAERQEFVYPDGSVSVIAMEPKSAVEWLHLCAEAGIFGVRFNEGEYGWFAPISDLRPMMEYLGI